MKIHTTLKNESSNTFFAPDDKNIELKKSLKKSFKKHNESQMLEYIKDLEESLSINKSIISELVNKSNLSRSKDLINALNKENAILQKRLKITTADRDAYKSKLLILSQIFSEYKSDKNENLKEVQTKMNNIICEIDRKEYFLQKTEINLKKAIHLLQKYTVIDIAAKKFLAELSVTNKTEVKISSVIEENKALKKKLEQSQKTVNDLGGCLKELIASKFPDEIISESVKPLTKKNVTMTETEEHTVQTSETINKDKKEIPIKAKSEEVHTDFDKISTIRKSITSEFLN